MAGINQSKMGYRDAQGDFVRRLAAPLVGAGDGSGPAYVAAGFTIGDFGSGTPEKDHQDAWWLADATSGALTIVLPNILATPLGTTFKATKMDSGGNAVAFAASQDSATIVGTHSTTTQGVSIKLVLVNNNGTIVWVAG